MPKDDGHRAGDGLARLPGEDVAASGSDLDTGVVFRTGAFEHHRPTSLQVVLEDVFASLPVNLVPLQRVDARFQFAAIDRHRVFASDSTEADAYELRVMRRAADLQPLQRAIEREALGLERIDPKIVADRLALATGHSSPEEHLLLAREARQHLAKVYSGATSAGHRDLDKSSLRQAKTQPPQSKVPGSKGPRGLPRR